MVNDVQEKSECQKKRKKKQTVLQEFSIWEKPCPDCHEAVHHFEDDEETRSWEGLAQLKVDWE